ncbi:hypothetical protein DENSPDRAFT_317696 [Dentipellis sp. KUC8613]|nr:hypothetical protein DENSPDRAFT_317696 [Dentipellis sp. KUC8613]
MYTHRRIPSDLLPPHQGDARRENDGRILQYATPRTLEDREPHPQNLSNARGTYAELINPNSYIDSTARVEFSLVHRLVEDIHLAPPLQPLPNDTYGFPDMYHRIPPPPSPRSMRSYILLEVAPAQPYPPAWHDEQPFAHTYPIHDRSVPRYSASHTPCVDGTERAKGVPTQEFRPLQRHEQSPASTSLRAESSSRESRRVKVAPVPNRAASSGKRGSQTLTNQKKGTQANDLGCTPTHSQSTAECLLLPLQGPSTPPPTPEAPRRTGHEKTKHRSILLPGMPKAIRISTGAYVCPHLTCNKIFTTTYAVARHYWKHLPERVKWRCTRCRKTYTRSHSALQHFRKVHRDEGPREREIVMEWPSTMTADASSPGADAAINGDRS